LDDAIGSHQRGCIVCDTGIILITTDWSEKYSITEWVDDDGELRVAYQERAMQYSELVRWALNIVGEKKKKLSRIDELSCSW